MSMPPTSNPQSRLRTRRRQVNEGQPEDDEAVTGPPQREPQTGPMAASRIQLYPTGKRKGLPKPCDSCRMRRIRCDRPPPPASPEPCLKCAEKGIKCTTVRETNPRRKMHRDGEVIRMALTQFGRASGSDMDGDKALNDSDLILRGNTHRAPPGSSGDSAQESLSLSESSLSVRLHDAELLSAVTLHLLDHFFRFRMGQITFLRWDDLRQKFEDAGRRPNEMHGVGLPGEEKDDSMKGQEEVLCAVLIAMSSRTTDCPSVLGPGRCKKDDEDRKERWGTEDRENDALNNKDGRGVELYGRCALAEREALVQAELAKLAAKRLRRNFKGKKSVKDVDAGEPWRNGDNSELCTCGRRRSAMFAKLVERAMRLADEKDIIHHPSLLSVTILGSFASMINTAEPLANNRNETQIRLYLRVLVEHLRIMNERHWSGLARKSEKWDDQYDMLSWTTFVNDKLFTAREGWHPSFSEDDFQSFCIPNGVPIAEGMHYLRTRPPCSDQDNYEHIFWACICPVFEEITSIATDIYEYLTSSKARRRPISEIGLSRILSRLGYLRGCLFDIKPNLDRIMPSRVINSFPCNVLWFSRVFYTAWTNLVFIMKKAVGSRRQDEGTWEWDVHNVERNVDIDLVRKQRFEALLSEIDTFAFDAARLMAKTLHEFRDIGKMVGACPGVIQNLRHLPQVAFELVHQPHINEDFQPSPAFGGYSPLGSRDDWTVEKKIDEIGRIIDSINDICWTYGDEYLQQTYKWLTAERDELVVFHVLSSGSSGSDSPIARKSPDFHSSSDGSSYDQTTNSNSDGSLRLDGPSASVPQNSAFQESTFGLGHEGLSGLPKALLEDEMRALGSFAGRVTDSFGSILEAGIVPALGANAL